MHGEFGEMGLIQDFLLEILILRNHQSAFKWFKYCVGNSGGGTFLVDQEGKILAICPTAEEVERILEKMLK